jgi:DNA-binding GntR family transcriptional regulator
LTDEADAPARTLSGDALGRIRELILTGVLRPGDRLRLEELATKLRTSPMPIREAIRRLEQLGLVVHIPHRGATVAPITVEELVDLYGVRLLVEPDAVYKAAGFFTEELFRDGLELLRRLDQAERSGDNITLWEAHTNFHFLFYRASRSAWLLRTIEPLWERAQCYRTGFGVFTLEGRHQQHLDILTACSRNDAVEASRLLYNHLAAVGNRMVEVLGGEAKDFFRLR